MATELASLQMRKDALDSALALMTAAQGLQTAFLTGHMSFEQAIVSTFNLPTLTLSPHLTLDSG